MARGYSYVVRRDYGFAPNPFYGFLTLATCKPKIRRKAQVGDFIIGIAPVDFDNKLVFMAKVSKVITFNEYWNNEEYYGFGAAAHGYVDDIRYYNYETLEEYMLTPSTHKYGKTLTEQEKLEEEIFLGFRKREGVNINKIKEKFGIDFEVKYKNILDKYSDFIEKTQQGYTLNLKGVLVSNVILADFLD